MLGTCEFALYFVRQCGVYMLFAVACSWIVRTLMACCDMILLFARGDVGVWVIGGGVGGQDIDIISTGSFLSYGPKPCGLLFQALVIMGTAPGVLF